MLHRPKKAALESLIRIARGDDPGADITDIEEAKKRRGLRQQRRVRDAKHARMIAYDLETTRIAAGTPQPLYITAYSENPQYALEMPIRNMDHLRELIITEFLMPEFMGVKFVAWNGNNFDAYFIAAALLTSDDYIIRPYLNKGNQLRGMRVMMREDLGKPMSSQSNWEFLDGMAMLGMPTTSLEKFLATFAPNYKKLKEAIDFESEEFDATNRKHREYAMRDSVGLWHGMNRAQHILIDAFNQPLTVTVGNACIKIFKAHIPDDKVIYPLTAECEEIVREWVMRGGFCYCVSRYHGPVWKYDLNQAYAAAMREARLPAGNTIHSSRGINQFAIVYIARISATNPRNKVPFYYCANINGRIRALFGMTEIFETWLTSIEIEQLKREGWKIIVHESFCWDDYFSMKDFVDKLERIRTTCEGGPSGPIGTMIKAVGNNAYGKTVSQAPNESLLLSKQRPSGYAQYFGDQNAPVENVWVTFEEKTPQDYEQPHVGAFITAHVRMVVRRAALLAPDAWLYADTDCAVFSRDVTALLDTDAKRYGAWKVEAAGVEYKIIAKKVYYDLAAKKGNAKGLNVKRLTEADYLAWFDGSPPTQTQVQRQNFVKVMAGLEMYRNQTRRGTAIQMSENATKPLA